MASSPERSEARGRFAGSPRLWWAFAGFALSLFVPATAIVERYVGLFGVAGYLLLVSALLLLLVSHKKALARRASKATGRQVLWLAALTFLVILVAFVLIYPLADAGLVGGGSDSDDALDIAATELLQGRYPYYVRTYLGNPISQLPGALLLAIPFVIMGYSAYQNLFWLILFFVAIKIHFGDGRTALLLVWALFFLSPIVLYHIITGSDYVANSLYLLLAVLWMARAIPQPGLATWKKVVPAVFLGIALSSRVNFVVVLPLVFSALARDTGWRSAARYTAVTVCIFLAITLPFYLFDPLGFSPLHTFGKLGQFDSMLPNAALIISGVTGLLALVLAVLRPVGCQRERLLRDCALVLAFPVLCGVLLFSLRQGRVSFAFAAYGVFFLFFGAVAYWSSFFEHTELEVRALAHSSAAPELPAGRADKTSASTGKGALA